MLFCKNLPIMSFPYLKYVHTCKSFDGDDQTSIFTDLIKICLCERLRGFKMTMSLV